MIQRDKEELRSLVKVAGGRRAAERRIKLTVKVFENPKENLLL